MHCFLTHQHNSARSKLSAILMPIWCWIGAQPLPKSWCPNFYTRWCNMHLTLHHNWKAKSCPNKFASYSTHTGDLYGWTCARTCGIPGSIQRLAHKASWLSLISSFWAPPKSYSLQSEDAVELLTPTKQSTQPQFIPTMPPIPYFDLKLASEAPRPPQMLPVTFPRTLQESLFPSNPYVSS